MGHMGSSRSDGYGLVASVAHLHCGVPVGKPDADGSDFKERFYGSGDDPTRYLVFVGEGQRCEDDVPPLLEDVGVGQEAAGDGESESKQDKEPDVSESAQSSKSSDSISSSLRAGGAPGAPSSSCSYSAPEERRVYLYLNPPLEFDEEAGEMRIAGGFTKEAVDDLAVRLRDLLAKMLAESAN